MCSQELREEIQYWRIIFKRDEMERKFQQQELLYRSTAHLYFAACLGVWAILVMCYEIIIAQQSHAKPPKFYIFYSICTLFTFVYILMNRFWRSLYTVWHWLFVCTYSLNIAWSIYDEDFIDFDNKKTFSYGLYSAILVCCYVDGGTFIPKVILNTFLITIFVFADSSSSAGIIDPRNLLRSLLPIALIAIKIRHEEFIKREMFLEKSKLEDMMSIIKNQIPLPFIIAKLNKRESKMNFHFGNQQAERQLGIFNQTTYETFMDNCFLIKQKSPHPHNNNLQLNQQLDQTQSHLTHTDYYNHLPSLASSQLPFNNNSGDPHNSTHPNPNSNFTYETHAQHAFAPQESGNSLRCLIRRKVENLLLSTKNSKAPSDNSHNTNNNNNQQHQIKQQQQQQQQHNNQKNNCLMNNSSTTATNIIKDNSILAPLNTYEKPKILTQKSTEYARANTSMTLPSNQQQQQQQQQLQTRGILLDKKRARIQSLHGQNISNTLPRRVSISGQTQSLQTNNNISQNPILNNEKSIILEEDELATKAQFLPANQQSIFEFENTLQNATEDIKQLTFLNYDPSPYEKIENMFTLEPNPCSSNNNNNNNNINNSKNSSTDNKNNINNSNSTVIFTEGEIHIESVQVSEFAQSSQGVNSIYQNETYQLFKPSQLQPTQLTAATAAAEAHFPLCQDKSEEQQVHPLRKVSAPRPPNQQKLSMSSFIRFSPQTPANNQQCSEVLSPLGIRPKTSTFTFPPTPQTFLSTITDRRSPFGATTNTSNTSTSHLILEKHKSSNSDMSYVNNFGVLSQTFPHLQSSPKRKKKTPKPTSTTAAAATTTTTSAACGHHPSDNEGEEKVDVEHSNQDNAQSAPTRYAVKYRMFRSNEIFVAIIIENESYKKKYKHEKLKNKLLSDIRSHQHCLVHKSLTQVSSILDQLTTSNPPPLLDHSSSESNAAHRIENQTLFQHSQALTELLACLLSMNLLHHTFILFNSFISKSFPSVTSSPSSSTDRIDLSQLIRSIASSLCCEARVLDKISLVSSQKYIIQQNAFLLKVLVFTVFRYLVQNSKSINSKLTVTISSNEEDNHKDICSSKEDVGKQASDREVDVQNTENNNNNNNNTKNQNPSQFQDETEQYIRITVKLPFNEKLFNILQSKDLFVFSFDSLLKDELSGDALRQSMWIIRTSCQIVSLLGPFAKLLITKDPLTDQMSVSFLIYRNLNVISSVVAPAQSSASISQILKPLSSRYEKKKQQERKHELTAIGQKSTTPFVNNCFRSIQMKPSFELAQQFSQEFH